MTDLERQVRDALAKLGAQHGVAETAPAVEEAEEEEEAVETPTPRERKRRPTAPAQQGEDAVLRDRYATLDGKRRVYVHEARIKRDGIYKAYVMDLKTRERFWTLCSRLTDVTREK
jgi:hypothetical protein